ncbi:MAG: class I SAM-dependent methyltransferase [Spirochaetaceae bacterium]|jgi:hypothetical protein|nr:class I SAM-dependent methyltransferase [Spirochaetaceae bacterium]
MIPASYYQDKIRAVDAKTEAQKIAFSPLTFQAARALLELGILRKVSDSGDAGLSREEIAARCGISLYGAGVLGEIALGMGILKLRGETAASTETAPAEKAGGTEERFVLGKTGWFLLEDELTRVNFNFTNDVCYRGAFELAESVKTGKPVGLKVFGDRWATIYEALSSLPEKARKSWFEFDHFYSDIAFPDALAVVFGGAAGKVPKSLLDIGGNTAKWAINCCKYNADVGITIVDLPGQTAVAEENVRAAGFSDRISVCPCNVLDSNTTLPGGADAVWMSQFLDCFSPEQITAILRKIHATVTPETDIYVLEPFWDMQRFEGSAFSLQAASLYFTCMANGNSKMYRVGELTAAVEKAGFELKTAHHDLGSNSYSLLRFRKTYRK